MTWEEDRKSIVGASEISTVARCTNSVEEFRAAMGNSADGFLAENDFKTPYELFHLKKGTLESKPFSPILSEFGHKMELFANKYLNSFEFVKSECQPQEVIKSDLHKLAGYTPDVFCEFTEDLNFKGRAITKGDKAVVEVKTYDFFKAKREQINQVGLAWQYEIQNQYQTMIQSNIDKAFIWAVQCYIVPLESEYNNDFYKGKACQACDYIDTWGFQWLCEHYDIDIIVHPIYESLHPLFFNSLDGWQYKLDNNIEPEPDFKRDSENFNKMFNNHVDEIKSHCKIKYGIDDGCVRLEQIEEDYPDLFDKAKIYYEKCSEFKTLKDDIESDKAKWNAFFKEASLLGVDDDRFSLKACRFGKGIGIKCSFKTIEESVMNKISNDKY